MRVPKSPTPFSERQVEPEIQKGEFETRSPEGSFGGIDERNMHLESQSTDLASRLSAQGDMFQINQAKNAWLQKRNEFLPQVLQTQGVNSQPYASSVEEGPTSKFSASAKESVMSMAKNPRQQRILEPWVDKQIAETNGTINTHVARQTTLATGKTYTDNIKNIIQNVPTYLSPTDIQTQRNEVVKQTAGYVNWIGRPETLKAQTDSALQMFDTKVVQNYLANSDIPGANRYFQNLKLEDGTVKTNIQKKIVDAQTHQNAENWYKGASLRFRNADGHPDLKALQNNIENNPKLNQSQKDVYTQVLKVKSGQDIKADNQAHKNSWEAFKGQIVKDTNNFSKDISTDDIYHRALRVGFDQDDAHNLARWAASQYAKDNGLTLNFGSSSLQTKHYTDIREQIAMGNIGSLKALESLQGTVTGKQFATLKTDWFNVMEKGQDTQKQTVLRRVRAMGTDVFGTDQPSMNNYMNTMLDKYHQLGTSGDASTIINDAKEYLKGESPKASNIWKNQEMYDSNRPGQEDQIKADQLRTFYTDYGKEVTDGIGEELRKSLKRPPTETEFADFINSVGGQEAVQRFTPTNNAMLSILRWNEEHPQFQPIPLDKEHIGTAITKYETSGGVF